MRSLQRMLCLVTVLVVPSASCADTVSLVSSRDTSIYQRHPDNSNGAGQAVFAGTTGEPSPCRALVGFDIAGSVPTGSTITGVQLSLVLVQVAPTESMPRTVELHRLLADWGEGTAGQGITGGQGFATPADGTAATWSHRFYDAVPWTNAGGDFVAAASGSTVVGLGAMAYVWDSTPGMVADVQSWLDNPASNFGWLLLGDESTFGTVREFFSREASDTAVRPSLVITFTPPSITTATQLLVTAPPNVTAGSPFDISVTAVDNNGNVVPGYTGTVTFSSSDSFPGALPGTYTFTAGDQGTHTFSGGTLFTAGSQTLTAQDTATASITGTATITVAAGPANHLLIAAPASAVSGTPFDVTVAALDPYGNVDTNYVGTVTWASGDADPGVTLPADYAFQAADLGMHTFPGGLTLVTLGDQTLQATDTVSGSTGVATVTVGPGP